ncbi:unannotated protein [freshwater metagenome]|uniref:Unannotated protein n=1 Tax=freshwater metagenome TaxID=449393 RepID=A0A6J6PU44_9ZZZZ
MGAHVVFERHRHTGERAGVVAGGNCRVDGSSGCTSLIGHHEVERVHIGLTRIDAGKVLFEHVGGFERAGANPGGDLNCGAWCH